MEALSLAHRIAVMHAGRIRQCAPTAEIYAQPGHRFVGGFIGSPPMLFLDGRVTADGAALNAERIVVPLPVCAPPGRAVSLGLRPEDMALGDHPRAVPATVALLERRGPTQLPPCRPASLQEVYDRPVSRDVVRLLGTPPINLLPAEVAAEEGGLLRVAGAVLPLPPGLAAVLDRARVGGPIEVGIRPEHLRPVVPGQGAFHARLLDVESLGPACALRCDAEGRELTALASNAITAGLGPGDPPGLSLDTTKLHPFGADGARLV